MALLALAACAPRTVTPRTYNDGRKMAGRPGLFSGSEGGFTVIHR